MNTNTTDILLGTSLSKRRYGLDILRAISVCLVILIHTIDLLPLAMQKIFSYILVDGVTVFFVLSGFLIGNILLKTISNNGFNIKVLANFWGNRWMRTLPPYYLVLIFLLIYSILSGSDNVLLLDKMKYFIFIQNFNTIIPQFFDVSWSLAVEEWFYLLTPLFLFLCVTILKIKTKIAFVITILLFLVLGHYIRLYRFFDLVYDTENNVILDSSLYLSNFVFRTQVISRLDSVIYGIMGSFCCFYYQKYWLKYKLFNFLTGMFLIFILPRIMPLFVPEKLLLMYNFVFSYTVFGLGVLLLLPLLNSMKSNKGFVYKGITIVSLVSYSSYLIHPIVIHLIAQLIYSFEFPFQRMVLFISAWILSLIVSVAMYRYVEKPCIDARRLFLNKE